MFAGYQKAASLNLYERDGFPGIAYSDGSATEDRLHRIIAGARDLSTQSIELAAAIVDWPSEYHLSNQRSNLVRPLGIRAGDTVLEIGCGCGAITRFLGETGADVTALEGSKARARIAAERCRDLPNVRVVADDLQRFEPGQSFDWILLVGVLEYAAVFSSQPDPVCSYLQRARQALAPHGRLVVAIENKLGLKYFNGCAEDHLGRRFPGIQGLYGPKTPRTFGKRELTSEIASAGLAHCTFYYPFPDYKLPTAVLCDEAFDDPAFNPVDLLARVRSRDYGGSQLRLYDEALALREIARNGLLRDLSHSFLVVATQEAGQSRTRNGFLGATYANRISAFANETSFVRTANGIEVLKTPLYDGVTRSRRFADRTILSNRGGTSGYVTGQVAFWPICMARADGGTPDRVVEAFGPWFRFLLERVRPSAAQRNCPWTADDVSRLTLPGSDLDLTPGNLIDTGETLVPIDLEWCIDGEIEFGWVVTRGVLDSLVGTAGFERKPLKTVAIIEAIFAAHDVAVSRSDIDRWIRREVELQMLVAIRPVAMNMDYSMSSAMKSPFDEAGRFCGLVEKVAARVSTRVHRLCYRVTESLNANFAIYVSRQASRSVRGNVFVKGIMKSTSHEGAMGMAVQDIAAPSLSVGGSGRLRGQQLIAQHADVSGQLSHLREG